MSDGKPASRPRRSLRDLLRRPPRGATVVVWTAAVAGLLWNATTEVTGVRVAGYAEARSFEVAALTDGRVATVTATLQQEVEAGDVVATLDDEPIRLALRAAEAELARLVAARTQALAALQAAAAQREAQHRAELRRFTTEMENHQVEVLRTEAALAADERSLARLEGDERPGAAAERDALAARIQGQRAVLAELRTLQDKARRQAEEFAEATAPVRDPGVELAPHDQAIAAQRARIEELRLAQRQLVLRAPTAGRVASLLRRPGEVVRAGEAILTVIEHEPSTVVAHLPEEFVQRIVPGTNAVLLRQGNLGEPIDAVVVSTGAEIERVPRRIDGGSAVPRWGFPVHVSC
ncbi:MAG TPA: HlyD family efflux transporter periplasmic adaptor subunit, partial [Planctomycetota bacterium]|nr:HlyD family efflux transporter periplasmic adaptor subunit [Planctomycetota bacterium]